MDSGHSIDCTITEDTEICCCEDSRFPLSPCSSTETLITLASMTMQTTSSIETTSSSLLSRLAPTDSITVWQPNLVDKRVVSISEVEKWVAGMLNGKTDITVLHLLIYLHATSDASTRDINHYKLIHAGKQYRIERVSDLSRQSPFLSDIASRFSTFQLFFTEVILSPPLTLLLSQLVKQATILQRRAHEDCLATYAEALCKLIKKSAAALRNDSQCLKHNNLNNRERGTFRNTIRKVFKSKPRAIAA